MDRRTVGNWTRSERRARDPPLACDACNPAGHVDVSTSIGSSPKLPAISAQAASKASLVAVSGFTNHVLWISYRRRLVTHAAGLP